MGWFNNSYYQDKNWRFEQNPPPPPPPSIPECPKEKDKKINLNLYVLIIFCLYLLFKIRYEDILYLIILYNRYSLVQNINNLYNNFWISSSLHLPHMIEKRMAMGRPSFSDIHFQGPWGSSLFLIHVLSGFLLPLSGWDFFCSRKIF